MPFCGGKKSIGGALILLATLFTASAGVAATISWKLPATYVDETPIAPADVRKIVVKVYVADERTGPWKWVATSSPGATSVMVMDPPAGQTLWYALKSKLNGMESEYSDSVRKTNLAIPIPPFMKKMAEKILTVKKMTFLIFLLLLVGLAWRNRRRRKRGGG